MRESGQEIPGEGIPRNIISRRICNFSYPDQNYRLNNLNKSIPDKLIGNSNKIKFTIKNIIDNISIYSPKFLELLKRITLPGKHIVFTQFTTNHGIYLLKKIMEYCDLKCLVYAGDNASEREQNLENFNKEDNTYGDKYKVLLLSTAGLQGINTMAVQHLHILDVDSNKNNIRQLIGRCTRMNSHKKLNQSNRRVNVYTYTTTLMEETTTDKQMGLLADKKMKQIRDLEEYIIYSSIENIVDYSKKLDITIQDIVPFYPLPRNTAKSRRLKKKIEEIEKKLAQLGVIFLE